MEMLQVIDAFIDGERVDAAALKTALADSSGRDYFVDVWLLREAALREGSAEAALAPAPVVAARRTQPRWLVAAAIAAGLIGGYAIGYQTTGSVTAPPTTTPTVVVSVPATDAFPVPAPTRVIQLDFHPAPIAGGD